MFCVHCGKALPDTARFCYACGKQLAPSGGASDAPSGFRPPQPFAASEPEAPTPTPAPVQRRSGLFHSLVSQFRLPLSILGILVLLALASLWIATTRSRPNSEGAPVVENDSSPRATATAGAISRSGWATRIEAQLRADIGRIAFVSGTDFSGLSSVLGRYQLPEGMPEPKWYIDRKEPIVTVSTEEGVATCEGRRLPAAVLVLKIPLVNMFGSKRSAFILTHAAVLDEENARLCFPASWDGDHPDSSFSKTLEEWKRDTGFTPQAGTTASSGGVPSDDEIEADFIGKVSTLNGEIRRAADESRSLMKSSGSREAVARMALRISDMCDRYRKTVPSMDHLSAVRDPHVKELLRRLSATACASYAAASQANLLLHESLTGGKGDPAAMTAAFNDAQRHMNEFAAIVEAEAAVHAEAERRTGFSGKYH